MLFFECFTLATNDDVYVLFLRSLVSICIFNAVMKRIIFHNPYVDQWYGKNVFRCLTGKKSIDKYGFMLKYFIKKSGPDILIYLDLKKTSFGSWLAKSKYTLSAIAYVEFLLWCFLNRVNIFKINIIFSLKNITQDDIFLSFSYINLDGHLNLDELIGAKCKKFFFLNHFMLDIENISNNAEKLNVDAFICENNLYKNSQFFREYFKWYNLDVYHLPYVFKDRFIKKINFDQRINKCLATGTFETLKRTDRTKAFMDFYKTDTFHPMRMEIHNKREELLMYINSRISDYNEVKPMVKSKKFMSEFYTKIHNLFMVKQRKYFNFDISREYNKYRMFVVPEEINDMPGIGFVEGMACGCAYIGKNNPMYTDLGLIPDFHYISYDGTLNSMISKISYFQANNEELEQIAERGYNFVINKFNAEAVAKNFYSDLMGNSFRSSFVA
jgi:glycosyltransferase involved in cell wall biosynthesis